MRPVAGRSDQAPDGRDGAPSEAGRPPQRYRLRKQIGRAGVRPDQAGPRLPPVPPARPRQVRGEWAMVCTAHNLLKLAAATWELIRSTFRRPNPIHNEHSILLQGQAPRRRCCLWGDHARFKKATCMSFLTIPGLTLPTRRALVQNARPDLPEAAVSAGELPGNLCPVLCHTSVIGLSVIWICHARPRSAAGRFFVAQINSAARLRSPSPIRASGGRCWTRP